MLLDLIPELLEGVFYYCGTSELKNLSRCCHDLKDICRGLLWGTVKIPPQELLCDTFAQQSQLQYLTYTDVLKIHGSFSKNVCSIILDMNPVCVAPLTVQRKKCMGLILRVKYFSISVHIRITLPILLNGLKYLRLLLSTIITSF